MAVDFVPCRIPLASPPAFCASVTQRVYFSLWGRGICVHSVCISRESLALRLWGWFYRLGVGFRFGSLSSLIPDETLRNLPFGNLGSGSARIRGSSPLLGTPTPIRVPAVPLLAENHKN